MKFRYKITLYMISLLAIFYGIGGTILISGSFHSALNREKESARSSYQMLLDTLQIMNQTESWNNEDTISDILKQLSGQSGNSWVALQLSDGDGILYQMGTVEPVNRELPAGQKNESCRISSFAGADDRWYLQASGLVAMGEKQLMLTVIYDISSIYADRSNQQRTYSRIYFVMLLTCLVVVYGTAYLLTRPLSKLSKATRRFASGNLSYRSMVRTNDEIGDLSQDFNVMADQVEAGVEQMQVTVAMQEQFMGSFAHELKTPMTSIIGYADLIRRQTLDREEEAEAANYIYTEGKRLERLSYTMLDIFSVEQKELPMISVAPGGLVKDMVEHLRPVYKKDGIHIRGQIEAGNCLLEPDLFRSLLLNLIDNSRKALKNNGQYGQIEVTLRMLEDGCQLEVADNGPGVSGEDMQRLTEAFYRVDKARSRKMGGAGLGLTLCERIVELHHGELEFQNQEPHGLRVIARLRGGREL